MIFTIHFWGKIPLFLEFHPGWFMLHFTSGKEHPIFHLFIQDSWMPIFDIFWYFPGSQVLCFGLKISQLRILGIYIYIYICIIHTPKCLRNLWSVHMFVNHLFTVYPKDSGSIRWPPDVIFQHFSFSQTISRHLDLTDQEGPGYVW